MSDHGRIRSPPARHVNRYPGLAVDVRSATYCEAVFPIDDYDFRSSKVLV